MVIYEREFAKLMRFAKIHAILKASLRPHLHSPRHIKDFSVAVSFLGTDQQDTSIVGNGSRPCLN